jgi:hypothetical protein
MKRIYKYPIPIQDEIIVEMPLGSVILTAQMQHSEPFIWCLVNSTEVIIKRHLYLYGTGMEVKRGSRYIGTFQMLAGDLIWHLFEE